MDYAIGTRRAFASLALLSGIFASGCGGGSGGDTVLTSGMIFSAPRAASAPVASGDETLDAFNSLNFARKRLGLNELARSASLDQSARNHSEYYSRNGTSGPGAAGYHTEIPGLPGFTGVSVTDRARSAGYAGSPVEENMSIGSRTGFIAAGGLLAVPYHRIHMLSCFADVGVGLFGSTYTMDFGGTPANCGPEPNQLVAYPYPDQDDVPIGTFSLEIPNPLPDIVPRQVGYPISLLGATGSTLALTSLTLTDPSGTAIPGRIVSTNTESGLPLGNYAFFIPLPAFPTAASPTGMLAWNTTYTVRAEGTYNGQAFSLSWKFKTGVL